MRILKFGGATVATPEQIKLVARRISDCVKSGEKVIVVVSAMGKTTSTLLDLARQVTPHPPRRELDMLLSVGERMTMSLVAMALNDLGISAVSLTGSQAGIITTEDHENADILEIKPVRVEQALSEGKTVIIAGFQGVSKIRKEITTLGRGGSDLTAVALAGYFGCTCEIVKEMPAVYQADPKLFPKARPFERLDFETLEIMTQWGSQMLNSKAASLAKSQKVHLLFSSATNREEKETEVLPREKLPGNSIPFHISHRRALLKFESSLPRSEFEKEINKIYDNLGLTRPEIQWPSEQTSSQKLTEKRTTSGEKNLNSYWVIDHPDTIKNNKELLKKNLNSLDLSLDDRNWMGFSVVSRGTFVDMESPLKKHPFWEVQSLNLDQDFRQCLIFFPENDLQIAVTTLANLFN